MNNVRFTQMVTVTFDPIKSKKLAKLENNLVWEIHYTGLPLPQGQPLDENQYISIPEGFYSDGVTVPRILWGFVPPWGHKATRAALLHDYLIDRIKDGNPHEKFYKRKDADKVFHEALLACGVGRVKSKIMYYAVRSMSIFKGLIS